MAELGEVRRTLAVQWQRYAALLVAGLVVLLLWTAAVVIGRVSVPLFIMAALMVKALLGLQIAPALFRKVEICECGLRVHGLGGPVELLFEDFEAIYLNAFWRVLPLPGEPRLARLLRVQGGETMLLLPDDLEDFDGLLARCANEVNSRRAGAALSAYDDGEPLHLGPLTLDRRQGVTFDEQTVPWSELGSVACRGGVLRLASGQLCPLALVPNPQWLLRVLEQHEIEVTGLREALGGAAG